MRKIPLIRAFLVGLITISSTAHATAFYVGAQLGYTKTNYDLDILREKAPNLLAATLESKGNGIGGRLLVGYQFNGNWSTELGWADYKDAKFTDIITSSG